MSMNQSYVDKVANQLIEQLQQGTAPWQTPWKAGERRAPTNPVTGKDYRGFNSLWLQMQGFSDPRWMTFNQAGDVGARVRPGSKGTQIVFWSFTEERDAKDAAGNVIVENGTPQKITVELEKPKSFTFTVFNAEQIDGLPPLEPKPVAPEAIRCVRAESLLLASGAQILHQRGGRAFYHPSTDEIILPERDQFPSSEAYFSTALHELGHWSGHRDRLDRDLTHPFGSREYAKEELRVEISSLMMGEKLDLPHNPEQHASYVAAWIDILQNDPREIFRASADAERISEHLLSLDNEQLKSIDQDVQNQARSEKIDGSLTARIHGAEVGDAVPQLAETEPRREPAAGLQQVFRRMATFISEFGIRGYQRLKGVLASLLSQREAGGAVSRASEDREAMRVITGPSGFERYTREQLEEMRSFLDELIAQRSQGQEPQSQKVEDTVKTTQSELPARTVEDDAVVAANQSELKRVYLAIPYAEKDEAKAAAQAAGFTLEWDKTAKAWSAPAGADLTTLAQWRADAPRVVAATSSESVRAEQPLNPVLHEEPKLVEHAPVEKEPRIETARLKLTPQAWINASSKINHVSPTALNALFVAKSALDDGNPAYGAQGFEVPEEAQAKEFEYRMLSRQFGINQIPANETMLWDPFFDEDAYWAGLQISLDQAREENSAEGEARASELAAAFRALQAQFVSEKQSARTVEDDAVGTAENQSDLSRVYLAIPYAEKDEAKAAAKAAGVTLEWDKTAKAWSAPADADLTTLAQWRADEQVAATTSQSVRVGERDGVVTTQQPLNPVLHEEPAQSDLTRVYLAVPYAEKDEAKAAAKAAGVTLEWDKTAKAWSAPADADLTTLAQWRADAPRVVAPVNSQSAVEQFAQALKAEGLIVKGAPIMDGKLHRVAVEGERSGQTGGSYIGHLNGQIPAGYIQNFTTGVQITWKADSAVDQLSPDECARLRAEAALQRDARLKERLALQEQTSIAAMALWNEAPLATTENAYCKAKGMSDTDIAGLRIIPDVVSPETAAFGIRIAKSVDEAKALRESDPNNRVFKAGDLLIPGYDLDGRLWTLQSVNPFFKSLMKDGRKAGLMTVAGAEDLNAAFGKHQDRPLIVAEGFATANTVSRIAGQSVVVAFDSGNLSAVCEELRERYPTRPMFIAADNDHQASQKTSPNGKPMPNVGMEKARDAAEKFGAGVIAPDFAVSDKGSDWNDFLESQGEETTRRHFAEKMAAARVEATVAAQKIASLADEHLNQLQNDPKVGRDDEALAEARVENAHALVFASAQLDEVYSKTANALAHDRLNKQPSAMNGIADDLGRLKESVREERSHILSHEEQADVRETGREPDKSAVVLKPRARQRHGGMDAGY